MKYEAAFPCQEILLDGMANLTPQRGMTLRDYFAAKAMQVLMTETNGINDDNPGSPRWQSIEVAELAYEQADAMLVARNPE